MIIKVGNGQMTLKDAKGTTLNITGTSNYEEHWFLEGDDNFTTADVSTLLNTDSNTNVDYSLKSELKLNQNVDTISVTSNLAKNK